MKNELALLALALLAWVSPARAQLDETVAQCQTRFGKPTDVSEHGRSNGTIRNYRKNGFFIVINFQRGRAAEIMFQKLDHGRFTAKEIDDLLTANRGGSAWSAPTTATVWEDRTHDSTWTRADGGRAIYERMEGGPALSVSTPAFNAAEDAKQKVLRAKVGR